MHHPNALTLNMSINRPVFSEAPVQQIAKDVAVKSRVFGQAVSLPKSREMLHMWSRSLFSAGHFCHSLEQPGDSYIFFEVRSELPWLNQ
jgi:hypothetical protein